MSTEEIQKRYEKQKKIGIILIIVGILLLAGMFFLFFFGYILGPILFFVGLGFVIRSSKQIPSRKTRKILTKRHNKVGIGLTIPFCLILVAGIVLLILWYTDWWYIQHYDIREYYNGGLALVIIGGVGVVIAILVWIVSSVKARKKH